MAEKDFDVEVGGESLVLRHYLALVVSEALTQRHGDNGQASSKGFADALGILLRQMAKHGVTGSAIHQHADGRTVARAHDQVAFIVASDQTIFDLGRAVIDENHIGDLALRSAPRFGGEGYAHDGSAAGIWPTPAAAARGQQRKRNGRSIHAKCACAGYRGDRA
jgi:hypothetical protein